MVTALPLGIPEIVDSLVGQSFAFADGSTLWPLLRSMGAQDEQISLLPNLLDEAIPQVDEGGAEVYPHKGTLCSYYTMDAGGSSNVTRSDCEHATRLHGRSIEIVDSTTINGNGSSFFRVHKAWPHTADHSSLISAPQRLVLAVLRALTMNNTRRIVKGDVRLRQSVSPSGVRAQMAGVLDEEAGNDEEVGNAALFEAMMTGFRVTRSATRLGEPGPEGVHQDSALLTVVMLLQRRNLAADSGGSRVWSLDQPCGKPAAADAEPTVGRLLGSHVLRHPFDALFLLDREVKHEALPIMQLDESAGPAIRDVLTFEVRRHCRSHA